MLKIYDLILVLFTILLVVNPTKSLAGDYFKACFAHQKNAQYALSKLDIIKAPTDRLNIQSNCIEISTSTSRTQLYKKYLKLNFSGYYKIEDLQSISTKTCKILLSGDERTTEKNNRLKLGNHSSINLKNAKSLQTTSSQILIQDNSSTSLNINSTQLKIHCQVRDQGYKLKIYYQNNNNSLSTSLFLKFGMSYPLGQILNNNKNNDSSLGINKGINYNQSNSQNSANYTIKAIK